MNIFFYLFEYEYEHNLFSSVTTSQIQTSIEQPTVNQSAAHPYSWDLVAIEVETMLEFYNRKWYWYTILI